MPRILFPFTRAKLNSIARLAGEKLQNKTKKKPVIVTVGMKQRLRGFLSEHQALADVLMFLHDPVIQSLHTR